MCKHICQAIGFSYNFILRKTGSMEWLGVCHFVGSICLIPIIYDQYGSNARYINVDSQTYYKHLYKTLISIKAILKRSINHPMIM